VVWPAPLEKGSAIALVAPARRVAPEEIQPFLDFCQTQGWKVIYDNQNLFIQDGFFAGSDTHRLRTLQAALDDDRIAAVWMARGGHGVSRIWPQLSWAGFQKAPKWLIGFSDGTPLLWGAAYAGVVALHAPVAAYIPHRTNVESINRLLGFLRGETFSPLRWARRSWYAWQAGQAQGHLLGGNLSLLTTLTGTDLDYQRFVQPSLLFWEEVGEYYYRLDRLTWHLRNAAWLSKAQGIAVGHLSNLLDDQELPFSRTPKEILREATATCLGPVAMGLPVGHVAENFPLPVGAWSTLRVTEVEATLTFEAS